MEELDQFFSVTLDLLCVANTDGYFLRLNPSWERILGHTREELMAKRFLDFVHPDDLERTRQAVSALASQQKLIFFENRYRCKDGTYRWFEWTATPVGNLIYAAARDVTERRLAQLALEERLRFERLLFDLSARFVNIPPDRVDSGIEYGLRQILEFFGVDRCGLVQSLPDKTSWQITHVAFSDDIPPVPTKVELPRSINPWGYEKLTEKHEVLSFSRLDDLPAEANVDRQTWMEWGIRSILNIPIMTGDQVDYIISVNSVKSERVWPEEYIPRLQLVGEIFVNALERKQIRLEIEERLRFEHLTSDVSAGFVNLPPDKVDSKINEGLRSVTEFFDADRCSIGLFSEDETQLVRTFEYRSSGAEPAPESTTKEQMPWYIERLIQGKPVVMNRVEDLPPEAEKERQFCLVRGMKSLLSIPMMSGGKTLGSCALVSTRAERVWPEELVQRLRLLSQVFANALQHRWAETMLRISEEKFRQFFAHTPEFCYIVSSDGTILDVNDCALHGLGYERKDLVGKPVATIYASESISKMKDLFARWKEKGEIRNEEMVVITKKGEKRTILLNVGAVKDQNGTIIHSTSIQTDITERKQMEQQLRERLQEIEELKQRLERENIYLQEEVKLLSEHTEIVGQSVVMRNILAQAEQVAQTDSTVMILGETGTGKELLARAIHSMSSRKERPLVTVNCASLPPTLIESELFGRERGACTGALTKMIGRFEIADGSTLFLDEIGELPLELQSKLLRVLEEGNFERLGSTKTLQVNVRIIAATNRDIEHEVKEGRFRKDLFYRLNVFPIVVPPLHERPEDIPLLVWAFVKEFQKKMGKRIDSIPRKSMEALQFYTWPGNVRELRNVIERGMIVSNGKSLNVPIPSVAVADVPSDRNLEDTERKHIVSVLEKTGWRLTGKGGAAEALGLKRTTLQSKMKKLGIKRPTS
jgi:formate hydrogenlyase transcriptional activator